MANHSNVDASVSPAPLNSRTLLADINAMLRSSAQDQRTIMQSVLNELRQEATGEIYALKKEKEDFGVYFARINHAGGVEHELRGAQDGRPTREQDQPLPSGKKMPKLSRHYAKSKRARRQWFRPLDACLRAYQIGGEDSRVVSGGTRQLDALLASWWRGRVEEPDDLVSGEVKSSRRLAGAVFDQFSLRGRQDVLMYKLDCVRQIGHGVRPYARRTRKDLIYLPHRVEDGNIHTFKRRLRPRIAEAFALRKPTSLVEAIGMALAVEAARSTRRAGSDKRAHTDVHLNDFDGESDETDYFSKDVHSEDGGRDCDDDEVEDVSIDALLGMPTHEHAMWWKKGKRLRRGDRGHLSKDYPYRKTLPGDH